MQNLKKNWFVVWKMTWGIWQIFTGALKIVKNWEFDEILLSKVENVWAMMQNWRAIDLSFQNWHGEFDEFWPEHLKVSKIFTLMHSFEAEYIFFELKSTEELSFMTLKSDTKFGEELTSRFKIDQRNLTNFDLSTWKSQKCSLQWAPFEQSIYCLS